MKYGIMLVAVKCLNKSTGCLSCRALNSDSASSCSSTAGHIGSIECLCTTDVEKKTNKQLSWIKTTKHNLVGWKIIIHQN